MILGKDENVRTFNEWITAHQAHDIPKMLTCLTDDVHITSASPDMTPAKGKQEAAVHWQGIYDAFPDMHMTPEKVTVDEKDENRLMADMHFTGTHKGNFAGKPATWRTFQIRGPFGIDFRDGKIREIKSYWEPKELMRQLGFGPPT